MSRTSRVRFSRCYKLKRSRAEELKAPINRKILAALAGGARDTDELLRATGHSYVALSNRLQVLKNAQVVRKVGLRKKIRAHGDGYVGIWELISAAAYSAPPSPKPNIAPYITIGRGFRWGASLV